MSETDSKIKDEVYYYDKEGNKVKDKKDAFMFWIRRINTETGELLKEFSGFMEENLTS